MKDDRFTEMLTDMEVPQLNSSAHQALLRTALVDASRREKQTHRKGFTMRRKILASATVGLACLAAIAASIVILTPGDQASAAQELAKQSSGYVAGLSPGDKASLTQEFRTAYHADPQQLLDEAQHAGDLTMLTYDQLKTDHPDIFALLSPKNPAPAPKNAGNGGAAGTVSTGGPVQGLSAPAKPVQVTGAGRVAVQGPGMPPPAPDLSSMKFLLFTNSQGQKILLGIGPPPDTGPTLTLTIDSSGATSGSISESVPGAKAAK